MVILYIGDVMGEVGMSMVEKLLPILRRDKQVDLVIAQAENVSEGKGITPDDFKRLQQAGVDFFTGGDHTVDKPEIFPLLEDVNQPIIGPANMRECPGAGIKYAEVNGARVLVVSLLGSVVGRYADREIDNPLKTIDDILHTQRNEQHSVAVVNFHGDYSSEKVIIGHYLDGRVSLVVGDHWHVPTADADILPKGTAHMTDVGMCGTLDSSLGITFQSVVPRWRDGIQTRNVLATAGRRQFNAVLVEVDEQTGKARSIERIRTVL